MEKSRTRECCYGAGTCPVTAAQTVIRKISRLLFVLPTSPGDRLFGVAFREHWYPGGLQTGLAIYLPCIKHLPETTHLLDNRLPLAHRAKWHTSSEVCSKLHCWRSLPLPFQVSGLLLPQTHPPGCYIFRYCELISSESAFAEFCFGRLLWALAMWYSLLGSMK